MEENKTETTPILNSDTQAAGGQQPVVSANMAQVENNIPPPYQKKKSKKKIFAILGVIVLGVVVLGVGGYWGYRKFLEKTVPSPTPVSQETIEPSPAPSVDPTEGWKVYTSSVQNITFEYPSDFIITKDELDNSTEPILEFNVPDTYNFDSFVLYIAVWQGKVSEYVERFGDKNITPTSKNLGSFSATEWMGYYKNAPTQYLSFIKAGTDNLYSFGMVGVNDMTSLDLTNTLLLNQILSTFEFLGPTVDTSVWETYINTKYNYSFKYPNNWSLRAFAGSNIPAEKSDSFILEGPYQNIKTLQGGPKYAIRVDTSQSVFRLEQDQEKATSVKSGNGVFLKFELSSSEIPSSEILDTQTFDQILSTFRFTD
jgi:hypothetical protein